MKNSRKSKIVFLSVYIIIIIAVLLCNNVFTDFSNLPINKRISNATYSDQNDEYMTVAEGDLVEQTIQINHDGTSIISIPYNGNMKRSYIVDLKIVSATDDTMKIKSTVTVSSDDSSLYIKTDSPLSSGNYKITFKAANELKLKASSSMDILLSVKVNGNKANQCIEVNSIYYSNNFLFIFLLALAIIVPVILILVIKNINWKTFVVCSAVFILMFIFILPYPYTDDEHYTNFNSNSLTLDIFNKLSNNTEGNKSAWLPSGTLNSTSVIHNKAEHVSEDYTEYSVSHNGYDLQLQYQYIPSYLSFKISGILGLSHYGSIILSRLITAIIYIFVCALAIFFSGKYKHIFYLLSASPLLLISAATMSTNATALAFTMLYLAICIRCIYDSEFKINTLHIILLILCAFAMATYKYMILLPFTFVAFAIPHKAFPGGKKTLISWILAALIIVCMGLHLVVVLKNPEILARGTGAVVSTVQGTPFVEVIKGYFIEAGSTIAGLLGGLLIPFATGNILITVSCLALSACMCLACILASRKETDLEDPENKKLQNVNLSAYIILTTFVLIIGSFFAYIAAGDSARVFLLSFIQTAVFGLILTILAHCASESERDIIPEAESPLTGALTLFTGCSVLYYLLTVFGCL